MIRIAIVDDEKVIREQIKKLIEKKQAESIIDTYSSGEELLMNEKCYDIVFLDIQMNGMNGIDTARALRQKTEDNVLIFITGVKEYVFDAFDVAAFHYLIKPIQESKFRIVYDRAVLEAGKKKHRNMAFVSEYSSDSITLNNGETIILTKEKYSEFVKVYMRYLKR